MVRKFHKLTKWLQECAKDEVTLSFADIENILGFGLSPSAYDHAAYWHASATHMLPKAWEEAGYVKGRLDFRGRLVTLNRTVRQTASRYTEVVPVSTHAVTRQSSQVPTRRIRHREESGLAGRIEKLCRGFETYVRVGESKYTGPSKHFHVRAVERFQALDSSVLKAARDERFLELVYATLVSWGMHDMRSARMPDFDSFTEGAKTWAPEIDELSHYEISNLSHEDTIQVMDKLWPLIVKLPGSVTKSKLVGNSKLLHHLLPKLVPPIDRANTGTFFGYKQQHFQGQQETIFRFVFPGLAFIAKRMGSVLGSFHYSGFNTSLTKVIDNAIIGYAQRNLKGKDKA